MEIKSFDQNGEDFVNNIYLICNGKDRYTLRSVTWRSKFLPNSCFVPADNFNLQLPISCEIFADFPYFQHRPVVMEVETIVSLISSYPQPRRNESMVKSVGENSQERSTIVYGDYFHRVIINKNLLEHSKKRVFLVDIENITFLDRMSIVNTFINRSLTVEIKKLGMCY